MLKKYNIVGIVFFIFVIIWSMITILYCAYYDVLTNHDMAFSYGREFLYPEHGRYLTTYINNLITEKLPEIFNIHPNDFQQYFINPFKAILVIFSCLYITNSLFLFGKTDKNLLILPVSNPTFTLCYIVIFLLLFNDNYFFKPPRMYYGFFENIVFLEYSMSIVFYVIVMSILIYSVFNNTKPNKINNIILLITAFILGISVEPANIPAFGSFCILALCMIFKLIKSRKDKEKSDNIKQNYKWLIPFYFVYFLSVICYFIKPNYHKYSYHMEFKDYLVYVSQVFINGYYNEFIGYSSLLIIPILVIGILIYYKNKNDKEFLIKFKKLILLLFIGIFSFMAFYALTFFMGYLGYEFYFELKKCMCIYKVALLFFLLVLLSFYTDIKIPVKANKIKVLLCIITLLVFSNSLIINYYKNINETREKYKEIRMAAYKAEKYATTINEDDNIILPVSYNHYQIYFWFLDNYSDYECGFVKYIKNVHPKIDKEYVIFSNEVEDKVIFTEDELKQLKFQNLLLEKMYRHKKTFNCLA